MNHEPKPRRAPSPKAHHIQIQRAFRHDSKYPARPATVVSVDDATLTIRLLDGTTTTVEVFDTERLSAILERDDLCRLGGQPLLLVSTDYGVMGIATGPGTPPSRLVVLLVSRLEDGGVVELINNDEFQPGWQILSIVARPS